MLNVLCKTPTVCFGFLWGGKNLGNLKKLPESFSDNLTWDSLALHESRGGEWRDSVQGNLPIALKLYDVGQVHVFVISGHVRGNRILIERETRLLSRVRDLDGQRLRFLLKCRVVVIGHQLVTEIHRLHVCAGKNFIATQNRGERLPEVRVKRVDDGIEGGIGPSEPHEDGERSVTHALAEGHHAVEHEKRQPAEHEDPHNDRECF